MEGVGKVEGGRPVSASAGVWARAARACTKSSIASLVARGMAPTMPKSMKATRPSVSMRRFPACTSAWNHSFVRTDETHVFSATMTAASGEAEYCRTVSRSVIETP